MSDQSKVFSGGCLCGAVRYEVDSPLRDVIGCHCNQCRRTSGHHVAATRAPLSGFRLIEQDGLKWFESSEAAKRGFCETCGSNLFWQCYDRDSISIFAGTLDQPTGLRMTTQMCTDTKGDYYDLDPNVVIEDGSVPPGA